MRDYIRDSDPTEKVTEVIDYGDDKISPEASVVIVTYNPNKKLLQGCLNSLREQTSKVFETLLVDNSDKTGVQGLVSRYNLKYIKLNKNYGLSLARNVGIKFTKGNIVIFLDDDASAANDLVEEHIRAYGEYDILGLRGKSLPRTSIIYNHFAWHYDLGNKVIPCYVNLEGNSSFKRHVLLEVGGFNPELRGAGGYEGLELTYRIIGKYGDKRKLIYDPVAVIYHDYADTLMKYMRKELRHAKYMDMLRRELPDVLEFTHQYNLGQEKIENNKLSWTDKIKLEIIQKSTLCILVVRKLASHR